MLRNISPLKQLTNTPLHNLHLIRSCKLLQATSISSRTTSEEAEVQLPPNKLWLLDKGPPLKTNISRLEGINALKEMIFYRELETEIQKLYQKKLIRGYCHLYNGQEAVCMGGVKALRKNDLVTTAYRCHMWVGLLGTPSIEIIAECLQKETGNSKGRGGSMHMYNEILFGGNGIVGAHVPIGTGIAFAMKHRKENSVCLTVYGDGAANQGQVFESLNLAALFKLPVVYLIENNQFGYGTSTKRSSATTDYFRRIDFVPGVWVDGMNYLSVREGVKFGINYAQHHGPIIIEANTYRYTGHSLADPGTKYRTREEVDEIRDKTDPIKTLAEILTKLKFLTPEEQKSYTDEARKKVKQLSDQALAANMPAISDIAINIYSKPIEMTTRGTTSFDYHNAKADLSLLVRKSLD